MTLGSWKQVKCGWGCGDPVPTPDLLNNPLESPVASRERAYGRAKIRAGAAACKISTCACAIAMTYCPCVARNEYNYQ